MREGRGDKKALETLIPCSCKSAMSSATVADTSLVSSRDVPACSQGFCRACRHWDVPPLGKIACTESLLLSNHQLCIGCQEEGRSS